MLAKVLSCAVIGLDGEIIEVEVDVSRAQNPTTAIVGLPDAAVQESRERVRSAVRNSSLTWPFNSRIVVNLAPADLRKEGPAYDLPIAVGVLIASGQVEAKLGDAVFVGEMALNGDVRPIRGLLPMVAVARQEGMKRAFVPAENAQEAALVDGIEIIPVETLALPWRCISRVRPGWPPPLSAQPNRRRRRCSTAPTSQTSSARNTRNGRSRWLRQVATTSSCVVRRVVARHSLPVPSRPFSL